MFDSKNERDNADYKTGYDAARDRHDPATDVANSLLRGFYGDQFNKGYEQGLRDVAKYGKRDNGDYAAQREKTQNGEKDSDAGPSSSSPGPSAGTGGADVGGGLGGPVGVVLGIGYIFMCIYVVKTYQPGVPMPDSILEWLMIIAALPGIIVGIIAVTIVSVILIILSIIFGSA